MRQGEEVNDGTTDLVDGRIRRTDPTGHNYFRMNDLGWHAAAYCDWQPIRPHPTTACKGGCGIEVDSSDGFCRRCKQ